MLLLLPISRYRVEYQVAAGRPYSIFEQLILRAIHQGTNSVSALGEIFQVHPRLILEALVTLTQAGWLAVGGPDVQGFKLTSAGEEAFSSGREPRSRNITSQRTWIVMERLTGALINEGMVRYLRTNQVTDMLKNALKISEQVHERKISEAQIDSFLPRDKNEWLYRINSIDLKSRQAHWLPTTLDVTTLQFDDNLPLAWRTRVGSALIEAAQRSPQFLEAEVRASSGPTLAPKNSKRGDVSAERVETERCAVLIEETDLLSTDDEHIVYLQHSLREVRSKLLIASAFMRANCLEALTTDLMAALSRGVAVDVLWGYNSGRSGEADGMEILKKIAFDARSKGYRGKINYNRAASGSHAKIIIWDHADSFEVCIGSYNWLSVSPKMAQSEANESRATNLSVRLRSSA